MITLIAAMNKYGTIGLDGSMPWSCPEDLRHFKKYTLGKTVVMGRKTFEGLPGKLPGRNIRIVSRNNDIPATISDFGIFLNESKHSSEEIVIAGGGEIYRLALPYADWLVLSFIDNDVVGDTFFPDFSLNDFSIDSVTVFKTFKQITYRRKGI